MEHYSANSRKLADYIYDDLGPEEIVEMENEILEDPELSESYRINMKVKDYLKAKVQLEEMRLNPTLEEAERLAEMAFDTKSGHHKKRSTLIMLSSGIAAAAAILITILVFTSSTDPDRLFQQYYIPLAASDYIQRGTVSDHYPEVVEGINSYRSGNYQESILLFHKLQDSDPGVQTDIQFFTGLSHMGLKHYKDAEEIFKVFIDNHTRYRPEAIWYLSLCYLQTGNIENAMLLLNQLENYDGMYKTDAQILGKKLRRIR